MSAFGSKLRKAEGGAILFRCPGCNSAHHVKVGDGPGPRWGFNGSGDAPTFTPSVLVRGTAQITDEQRDIIMAGGRVEPAPFVCHSYVTDGRIQFLGDCTHALAGHTVDLPDWRVEP